MKSAGILKFSIIFGVVATGLLMFATFAGTEEQGLEAEASAGALVKSDSGASEGEFIEFAAAVTPVPETPIPDAPAPEPTIVVGNPVAGNNGQIGCRNNCQTVGFQNLDGQSNKTLENVIISNPGGRCMSINNATNIVIRNVTIKDCATQTTLTGSRENPIILVFNSRDVTFQNVKMENLSRKQSSNQRNNLFGVNNTKNFKFINSEVKDLHSDINVGNGADDFGNRAFHATGQVDGLTLTDSSFFNPGRNVLQLTRARNLSNVSIERNRVEGRGERDSDFEDMINFFSASGTSSSYIRVVGNYFRDGGPSPTGTGIIIGDGKTDSGDTENILVEGNVFLDTGDVGLNVAGGKNFIVRNNKILGSHTNTSSDSIGLVLNHFRYTPACSGHLIEGNKVFWKNTQPYNGAVRSGGVNHFWNSGTCQATLRNNVIGDTSLTVQNVWPF